MSYVRVLSITHNCEFTREFPSMVNNHLYVSTEDEQHVTSIADYAKQLVGVNFIGQTTEDEDTDYYEPFHENLGTAMEKFYNYLEESEKNEEDTSTDKIKIFIEEISKYRKHDNETDTQTCERLLKDCHRFLDILKKRGPTDKLCEPHYWGTRQQLLAGKVIADWVDPQNGPLDPIFGALLTPTAGRVGPGNGCLLHCIFYDNDGKYAYHSAIHDGFGFLKKVYDIGPGYDYMSWKILGRSNMLAGQITGLLFWKFLDLKTSKNAYL